MVILHLSDLHFGSEKSSDAYGLEHRNIVLSGLLDCIKSQDSEWQPEIICISGDIGYSGKKSDYDSASTWLKELLDVTGLTPNEIILCPGNHDVDRSERGFLYPSTAGEADESLKLPVPKHIVSRFDEYTSFCKSFGIPPLQLQQEDNYLVGSRFINSISFVSLNSSWFCNGKLDKNRLWMGRPHIISLESSGILKAKNRTETTVTLVHHPDSWLHEDETNPYGISTRFSTFDYLAARCDIILTGHTHAKLKKPNKIVDSAWHVTAGAAFDNSAHFNSFSLMKVSREGFTSRQFEFDPSITDGENWLQKGTASYYAFVSKPKPPDFYKPSGAVKETSINEMKEKSIKYAAQEKDKKSRAIKGMGALPHLIERDVSVFIQTEQIIIDDEGKFRPNHIEIREPFISAVKRNSKTILLAELGGGKSTQATQLVQSLIEKENSLAFLVPASKLKGGTFGTIKETINKISELIKDLLLLEGEFSLIELMSQRIEVTVVVDGIDELESRQARIILERLSDVVNQWAQIRIVVTGRPIELVGFNYEQWQLLGLARLNESEIFQLFYNESIANGMSQEKAESDSQNAIAVLNSRKQLSIAASTPLFLRLLYPRLSRTATFEKYSLGDLLFDLLDERLMGWSSRSSQDILEEDFEKTFPIKSSRLSLIAKAASVIENGDNCITRFSLEHFFCEEFTRQRRSNPEILASQVVSFLLRHILVEENGFVSFPVQPLLECSLAVYHIERLATAEQDVNSDNIHWRIVSFMATYVRRINRINEIKNWFNSYLADLMKKNKNTAAASLIVVESENSELALHALSLFKKAGFRPIFFYGEDSEYIAECIARTLFMAGDEAMFWFYNQYLDPTKPTSDRTTEIAGKVISYWVKLSKPHRLSHEVVCLFKNLIKPHMLVEYHQNNILLGSLALLLPDLFSPAQRSKLLIYLLWRSALNVAIRSLAWVV